MNKILILGGTQFIGRNLVEKLSLLPEYEITLFNRQKTASSLFPEIKKIKGDRETDDIKQIATAKWDYIVDLSCYLPATLSSVLNNLKVKPKKYIFISTCSVYDNELNQSILKDETAPICNCTEAQSKEPSLKYYGNKKAACEGILHNAGLNHVILRPALVVGPYDHTDRFYYWLHQVKEKDTWLLPNNGLSKFSITYVKDLIDTIFYLLQNDTASSIFNVISWPQTSIQQIVDCASQLLNRSANRINASPDFLKEQEVRQWMDMPLWIDGDYFTYSNQRMKMECRIEPTEFSKAVKESTDYFEKLGWPVPKYGLPESRRRELIGMFDRVG